MGNGGGGGQARWGLEMVGKACSTAHSIDWPRYGRVPTLIHLPRPAGHPEPTPTPLTKLVGCICVNICTDSGAIHILNFH